MAQPDMKEDREAVPPPSRGNTVTQQGENQVPKAQQPFERDESAHSQAADAASVRDMGELAHADATSARKDTDKGPAMDDAYEKQKDGAPKQRRD